MATNVEFVGNVAKAAAAFSALGDHYLTNVTFAANEAEEIGGIRFVGPAELTLHNAVLWANTGGEIDEVAGGTTLRYVLSSEGCPPDTPFGETICEHILDADPLFVRPPSPGPDGTWGTPDDDYGDLQLLPDSPALDFGSEALLPPDTFDLDADGDTAEALPLDLAGEARVQGTGVDLGAYERPVPVASEPDVAASSALRVEAYPNPSRGPVAVSLALGRSQRVEVALFDAVGRRVSVVHAGRLGAGRHGLRLEASSLPSGVYVVRARGEQVVATQRLVLLR